jgi:hypothetical protein
LEEAHLVSRRAEPGFDRDRERSELCEDHDSLSSRGRSADSRRETNYAAGVVGALFAVPVTRVGVVYVAQLGLVVLCAFLSALVGRWWAVLASLPIGVAAGVYFDFEGMSGLLVGLRLPFQSR